MNIDFVKGIVPPIITPIDDDERIDADRMTRLVDFMIDGGVHGLLAFGSNGEFYMVDDDEMERGLEITLAAARGRVPVFMGIGAIRTRKCIRLAQMARDKGAAAVSVLQPMFLKPTEDELYRHFNSIADAVAGFPMLLYNNPARTGYTIPTSLVVRLAEDCDNIVGIKDSSGDMTQTAELIRLTRHLDFRVFGGRDTLIYATLAHGGAGAVPANANMFPELVCSIYEKYMAGDHAGALAAQFRLNPVRLVMDKASFPVATKDMANIVGLDAGKPYRPSLPSNDAVYALLKGEIEKAGLIIT